MPSQGPRESRRGHGEALAWARRDTAAARARLERIYGRVPACVFFYQREPEGEVSITHGLRIVGSVAELYRGDHRPVIVRAAVPGGRALAAWFERRPGPLVTARLFAALHARVYTTSVQDATVTCLRSLDPVFADAERLYRQGVTITAMAELAGVDRESMRQTVDRMRALGFDMPHRQTYYRRKVQA
jgi:hypothetical protein